MEQLWLIGMEEERAVGVELEGRLQEELVTLMASAIIEVYRAESEAEDE
jgi:hypothetical protein